MVRYRAHEYAHGTYHRALANAHLVAKLRLRSRNINQNTLNVIGVVLLGHQVAYCYTMVVLGHFRHVWYSCYVWYTNDRISA